MKRQLFVGLAVATLALSSLPAAMAQSQRQMPSAQAPGILVARSPDLVPIPSRLGYGVVSVRNVGAAASGPSVVTINCHRAGERGGCAEIPASYEAAYTDGAYPNKLVVHVPALAAGHVYNHNLPFWAGMSWSSGTYNFDFVADAGAAVAESNEGNNTGTYVKVVP